MKIELSKGIEVSSRSRTKEFSNAVAYLLKVYPPVNKHLKFLRVRFYQADYVSASANADYNSPFLPTHIDGEIRVSYGKDGSYTKEKWAVLLFHEYRHLLQEDELQRDYAGKEYCVEAQAWAELHVPLYLESLKERSSK